MPKPDNAADPSPRRASSRRGLLLYTVLTLIVTCLLALYYIVKQRAFAFVDIGLDSFSYYYPFQVLQSRQWHQLHTLSWSFEAGLGSYIGWVSNAETMLKMLFPESWQLAIRLPVYLVRLLLAGGFMFGYLRKLRFEQELAAIGGLAFAFCGYAMVNGQWDTAGYFIPQLAAYLFCFESYFRGRNRWFAVAAGLVVGSGGTFDLYTFSLLTVLYVGARPLLVDRDQDAGAYLPSLLRFAAWAALGVLVTTLVQIPNLIYFLSSPRVSGDHSAMHYLFDRAWSLNNNLLIAVQTAGLFGKGLLGTGSDYRIWGNWFEAPGFYVGMLLLVCIPQLFGSRASRREHWMGAVGLALLATYMLWPFMRFAVYGFGHAGFRLSTLWVSFGLLILGMAGLRRAWTSGPWRTGLVASAIGMAAVMLALAWRMPTVVKVPHLVIALGFTGLYCVLLWPLPNGRPRISAGTLACIFACELLMFAIPPVMDRNAVKTDGSSTYGSYHDGTGKALAWIRGHDESGQFFRVEKTYRSVFLDDALVQGYSGTKSYFFHGKSITRFVDKMHLPRLNPRTNYISSMAGRPKVLDLLGVRYLLARDDKLDNAPGMRHIGTVGKIHIYRNTDARAMVHLYREVASEAEADALDNGKRDALLLDKIVVANPDQLRAQLAALERSRPAAARSIREEASLQKISDVRVHAYVNAARASVLLITMPFDRGWSATLDGKDARLFQVDYGLTGVLVPAGRHEVDLRYRVPGRLLGEAITLAALLVLLGLAVVDLRRRRRSRRGNA